jgi:hypothetical protein
MRLLLILLLGASRNAAPQAPPPDLARQAVPAPGENLTLWLPKLYEADPKISLKFDRKPTAVTNEAVSLRLALLKQKLPRVPSPPAEVDLLKIDPSLTYVKFTGSVTTWKGRTVPTGRYEGFVQGKIGVYGRVIWLPLEPGTVVLDLYAEPPWVDTLNRDWDAILGNISGPVMELTVRETAPNRWLAAKILAGFGGLVAFVGLLMIAVRMNEAIGGSVTFLALLVPIVPLGYAVLNLGTCKRGLGVALGGLGLFGLSLLLERG